MESFKKALENNLDYISKLDDLSIKDPNGKSLLEYAVLGNSIEVINYLIGHKIDINSTNHYGENALFDCARKNKIDIAKTLILNNIDVSHKNKNGETVFHIACFKGDYNFVKLLKEKIINTNIYTHDKLLPIHYLVLGGHSEDFEKIFNLLDTTYDILDENRETLLHYASKQSSLSMVQFLLTKGLDCNSMSSTFETPIFNAVKNGHLNIVKTLLKNGAFINVRNRKYENILDISQIFEYNDIEIFIKEYLENPKYIEYEKNNILVLNVLNRDYDSLRSNKNIKLTTNKLGKSALDYARLYNFKIAVDILTKK